MNALDVINLTKSTLEPLGQPVHVRDFLRTNEQGKTIVPDDAAQFVLDLITGEPEHEWGKSTHATVTVQVAAYSTTEGHALAMLQAAQPLLVTERFVPRILVAMPRDGPYTGYAQRFDRSTA